MHLTKKYFSNELQIYENITMEQIKKVYSSFLSIFMNKKIDQKTVFFMSHPKKERISKHT